MVSDILMTAGARFQRGQIVGIGADGKAWPLAALGVRRFIAAAFSEINEGDEIVIRGNFAYPLPPQADRCLCVSVLSPPE